MTTEQVGLVAAGAVALGALLVAALALRAARRAVARSEELSALLAERGSAPAVADPAPYVITGLDPDLDADLGPDLDPGVETPGSSQGQRIDGRLFADLVARETTVRAASWAHGVRRALSAESRNRIGFQVRQQAKQARRDRRSEVREALREYRARQRADERAAHGDAA